MALTEPGAQKPHRTVEMLERIFLSGQPLSQTSHNCSTLSSQHTALQIPIRRPLKLEVQNRVHIRFQRYGRRKVPFYRIVAIDSKDRRDGRPIERLGWYNPLSKETSLDAPAIKKWLSVGAKPTEAAARVLRRAMVIDPDISETDLA